MAEEIVWNSKYSLGIEEIDKQHQHLFDLANQVFRLEEDNSKDEIRALLVEFSEYMKTHFKDEEKYMESIGYPELQSHKKLHQDLIESLANSVKNVKSIPELKHKIKDVAKKVLVDHIVHSDVKIKIYQNQDADLSVMIDDLGREISAKK